MKRIHTRSSTKSARPALVASLVVIFGCTPASPPNSEAADSTSEATDRGEWVLTPARVGSIEIGMSLSDALPYLEGEVDTASISDGCAYVTPTEAPAGLSMMVEGRRVVRAEVKAGDMATAEGARIGDDEQRILALYPSARKLPHKYTNGSYLIVLAFAPSDTLHRYVFETDGQRVTVFRAGLYPPVEYVEGCS